MKVDTGGRTVNLLHDRVNASTECDLENVTLVRRSLSYRSSLNPDPLPPKIRDFLGDQESYAGAINQAVRDLGRYLADANAQKALDRIKDLKVEVEKIAPKLLKGGGTVQGV